MNDITLISAIKPPSAEAIPDRTRIRTYTKNLVFIVIAPRNDSLTLSFSLYMHVGNEETHSDSWLDVATRIQLHPSSKCLRY